MLYTEFLKGIKKPDSESTIEAYADISSKYADDRSLTEEDAIGLYDEDDYNWIDTPRNFDGNPIESETRGDRHARITKYHARDIVSDEFRFDMNAVKVRGLAYFTNSENCLIRFEVGEHAFVYANGRLHESARF
ncbi:hypothetical protein AGMMS49992_16530 [Clostridia bacterium]|nr:hypothetical protein AGMMS49992_16530 [Clostridia bacterium]